MKKVQVMVYLIIVAWQLCEQEGIPVVPIFWRTMTDLSVWVSNGAWELARQCHQRYEETVRL